MSWMLAFSLLLCALAKREELFSKRIVYYSPTVIGENPPEEQDIYTPYYSNLHKSHIAEMKRLGATHILVSENWVASGSHTGFLDILNGAKLKLIITFGRLPASSDQLSKTDYYAARDIAKQRFIALIEEFKSRPEYVSVLEGFHIPPPPADVMSTRELELFYDLVTDLGKTLTPAKIGKMFVGYPINPTTGGSFKYDFRAVRADYFTMEVQTPDAEIIRRQLLEYNEKVPNKKLVPIISVDNYNETSGSSSDEKQVSELLDIIDVLSEDTDVTFWGMGMMEFSDEWWRSKMTVSGVNSEGCPNVNPYAHTGCGIALPKGDLLNLEYIGLYEIFDRPFHFCVRQKPAGSKLQELWTQKAGKPSDICVFLKMPFDLWGILGLFLVSQAALWSAIFIAPSNCCPGKRRRGPKDKTH